MQQALRLDEDVYVSMLLQINDKEDPMFDAWVVKVVIDDSAAANLDSIEDPKNKGFGINTYVFPQ